MTPGQIAYEAYGMCRSNYALIVWAALTPEVRAIWEGVAAAVLAHVPGYTVEYDENGCAWLIEQATRLRIALSHGMTLRIEQITLPAYQQQEPRIPTCRWCGQAHAVHPQAGEPWRCRLSDGPLLPREETS